MKALYAGIFFCCFSLFSCQKAAQKTPVGSSLQVSLDSLMNSEHEAGAFHGTLIVGTQDSILYSKAIGIADRRWDIPMRPDYRFDIASLNKSFQAALVLMAVEEGKLKLNDKLRDLLKEYPYRGRFDSTITVHHILTHTSGLPDYDAVPAELLENNLRKFKRMRFNNGEYVDFISQLKPVHQAGKQFYYSNFGYHLLAIILEDRYKQPFSVLLQEKICQPLNLSETFSPTTNEEVHSLVVEGYNYSEEEGEWERNNFIDLSLGRRIFSSVGDLYKWGKAMNDTSLLTSRSLVLMKTNHLSELTNELSYGYGWVVFDGRGAYQIGKLPTTKQYLIHGGATEGYKSMLVNIENGKYIIAFLSNAGSRTNEMALTQKIVHLLTNEKL